MMVRHPPVRLDHPHMLAEGTRRATVSAPFPNASRSLAGRMRSIVSGKVSIDITLEHEGNHVFSTMDEINGSVAISVPFDIKFDDVEITFEGTTTTYVERLGTVAAVNGRTEAYHKFLKLTMPISQSDHSESRTFETGESYKFPFHFAVPNHLLLSSCRHKIANLSVRESHLQVPPSLGDDSISPMGDDFTPDMAKIVYGVRVRILNHRDRDGKDQVLGEKLKKLRVLPATEEQPPVNIEGREAEYCMRKEKGIRKGIFKSKIGRIVMEAAQPRSFSIPAPVLTSSSPSADAPITTTATVMLRFDPTDANSPPPKLGSLSSKLRILTYYATTPMRENPSRATITYDYSRSVMADTINLSSRQMASVQWEQHHGKSGGTRRDSACSSHVSSTPAQIPEPSTCYVEEHGFWVASLIVPVSLPTQGKIFAPSFHTCLVSRLYVLDLSLSISPPSGGVATSTTLKLPIQVSIQARPNLDSNANEDLPPPIGERHAEDEHDEEIAAALEAMDSVDNDYYFAPSSVDRALGRGVRAHSEPYVQTHRPQYERQGSVASVASLEAVDERRASVFSGTGESTFAEQRQGIRRGSVIEDGLPPDYSVHAPRRMSRQTHHEALAIRGSMNIQGVNFPFNSH